MPTKRVVFRRASPSFHEQVRKIFPLFDFDSARYPTGPGCYLMKNARGEVIYVGKAKNLRDRLCSYFQSRQRDEHTARLVARIAAVDVILTGTENESLLLENNLIKRYRPHFNRRLKSDSEGYLYIALTREKYPRLRLYRHSRWTAEENGQEAPEVARRFGPYVSGRFASVLLEFVVDAFRLRTCENLPSRACLRFHIHRCPGMCEHPVPPEAYAQQVAQAVEFLEGQLPGGFDSLIESMRKRMAELAERMEFEHAQRIRDQITAMEITLQKQSVERDAEHDQDVLYFGEQGVQVLEVRRGAVLGLRWLPACRPEDTRRFLLAAYPGVCPPELIVNRMDSLAEIAAALAAACGHAVNVTLPDSDAALELLRLCELNYHYRAEAALLRTREDNIVSCAAGRGHTPT